MPVASGCKGEVVEFSVLAFGGRNLWPLAGIALCLVGNHKENWLAPGLLLTWSHIDKTGALMVNCKYRKRLNDGGHRNACTFERWFGGWIFLRASTEPRWRRNFGCSYDCPAAGCSQGPDAAAFGRAWATGKAV